MKKNRNMKNRILKTALVLSTFVLALGCSSDDYTGDSTQTPTNPSLSVTLGFANTQTLIEQESSFPFTVTISEPQIVSVFVYLTQTGGTADSDDFSIPASVTIPAGATSASGTIDIHADDLVEDTETAVITIATGLESNVQASNSQTVTFNIANLVEGDLQVGLMWDTLGYQFPDGSEFDPTVLADLRMLITTAPNNSPSSVFIEEDGGSFESGTLSASDPDGVYYLVADWYAAYDLGDQGFFPLNLTATFDQVGVINDMELNFANALDSQYSCSAVYYVLAKITKTGQTYDIENVGESPQLSTPYIGTATVLVDDWADYSVGANVEIEVGGAANEFYIRNYSNPAVANPDSSYLIVTIDQCNTNNVTVISNTDYDYGCSAGEVVGSGTVDSNTGIIDLILDFDLGNCGAYPGQAFSLQL